MDKDLQVSTKLLKELIEKTERKVLTEKQWLNAAKLSMSQTIGRNKKMIQEMKDAATAKRNYLEHRIMELVANNPRNYVMPD